MAKAVAGDCSGAQQAEVVGDAKALVRQASALRAQINHALDAPRAWRVTARQAYTQAVEAMVNEQLFAMPIARIRETTEGRLRLGPVEAAGYQMVGQAAAAGIRRLEALPGVGAHTATQVVAAANQLHAAMMKTTRLRFDADRQPEHHGMLLGTLAAYEVAQQAISPIRDGMVGFASELDAV
ncbi:MAG: hypothetical protein ACYDH5_06880, partial [Acidimicrobiales bacterium]